jgi:molecular chaperone GrpE
MKKDSEDNEIIPENNGGGNDGADESVVAEESAGETIKSLREKLKKSLAEKADYLAGWQRAKADLINARKRDEEFRLESIKFANESLIQDLIPVLDNFNTAMANKEAWEKIDANWRKGVEYIAQQLKKVLEDNGLKEINPQGETFDPVKHEAVDHKPVADKSDDHKIISVAQKGYSLNGKIIKVPKVIVGEYKS